MDYKEAAMEVIEHLNRITGKSFRLVDTNLKLVIDRLKSGISVQDLKRINAIKTKTWKGTEQEIYLRPSTLYNKTKCEQYLGQLPAIEERK
jgi:uncharacterized phage protein (TIGR02220 family)